MYELYCRIYQTVIRVASYFLPWRIPDIIEGENSFDQLPQQIKMKGFKRLLIVTDEGIVQLGMVDRLVEGLENEGIQSAVYDQTVPNPTIDNIEDALQIYRTNECEAMIAIGGGSPMDCAKGVGARIARPNKMIPELKGLLTVRKKTPTLFAVPTTAGTGSEGTVASVVTNSRTHEKYAIKDMALTPEYAVLDPILTKSLPRHITSTTGMDALTHAIEAYIGRSNTSDTKMLSKKTVELVFKNLYKAYKDGENLEARKNMLTAAYFGGLAFTRAYVGNVHAIAHTLGGFYNVPHGLANAVILPYVLEYYGGSVHQSLSELADVAGIGENGDTEEIKAQKFIDAIKDLNKRMDIPAKINGIQDRDIPTMVNRAFDEANPLYPVPKILSKEDFVHLYGQIKA